MQYHIMGLVAFQRTGWPSSCVLGVGPKKLALAWHVRNSSALVVGSYKAEAYPQPQDPRSSIVPNEFDSLILISTTLLRTGVARFSLMAGEIEVANTYAYAPLQQPEQSIRLIKIIAVTPQIFCQLKVRSLEDSPTFSALSYTRGDPITVEQIVVGRESLDVTTSLACALRDVYHQWREGHLTTPEEEQWLWADAVSINQEDVQGKNFQVPLMGKIYSAGYRVISWLGAETKAHGAIDALNLLSHEITQLPGYEHIRLR